MSRVIAQKDELPTVCSSEGVAVERGHHAAFAKSSLPLALIHLIAQPGFGCLVRDRVQLLLGSIRHEQLNLEL